MDAKPYKKHNEENTQQDSIPTLIRTNLFQILGLLAVIFNMWIAYKLAPLASTVDLNSHRIGVVEASEPVSKSLFTDFKADVVHRLDRIEDKIDRIGGVN